MTQNIRNFVIIAHVDAGKSTLADRMLEITGTVDPRRMRPQYLDQLELERERGITIKMAPVRMHYTMTYDDDNDTKSHGHSHRSLSNSEYILNLIDTPGHSDFSYEVSRALAAVEGAILLVDATKGIQAQTLANFRAARKAGLAVVGAVSKTDLFDGENDEQLANVIRATAEFLGVLPQEIFKVSGKTGDGVPELLKAIVHAVPPPRRPEAESRDSAKSGGGVSRALIFDSLYDDHKGILAYVRVFEGEFRAGEEILLAAANAKFKIKEIGFFAPELKSTRSLAAGEIGYVATGLKEPAKVKTGDTIAAADIPGISTRTNANSIRENQGSFSRESETFALPGYKEPTPVIFISLYPDGTTTFDDLKRACERLRLTDAALRFEPDANEALGRGLKAGFLGQLHFEITASRLEREFGLEFLTSFPSIAYRVKEKGAWRTITDAHDFPSDPEEVSQPMIRLEIVTPHAYLNSVVNLKQAFEIEISEIRNIGKHSIATGVMPLAELIRDFDDQMKSVSAGFASFSYELIGEARAKVEKLEILVAGEVVPALTRIVARKDLEREARQTTERLKELLPRQQFVQAIQARVKGRIVARETIAALRKDVTGYLYGGDRSRKMKLWKKQKRGKEKLKEMGRVQIGAEVFRKILKK